MTRVNVKVPERLGKTIVIVEKFIMPAACYCDVERMRKDDEISERKERRSRLEKAYKRSIMNDKLKSASFDNFIDREGSEVVLEQANKFIEDFETRKYGLLFYGKPGNGKSHLTAAIHHKLDSQGFVCLFLDWSQLVNIAKDTMNDNSKVTISDIIRAAVDCDLLTLDEIGAGSLSEFEFAKILFPIINGRQGKLTNFTSNLNLARLKAWFEKDKFGKPVDEDGRMLDRLLGSVKAYENKATSKRLEDAMSDG